MTHDIVCKRRKAERRSLRMGIESKPNRTSRDTIMKDKLPVKPARRLLRLLDPIAETAFVWRAKGVVLAMIALLLPISAVAAPWGICRRFRARNHRRAGPRPERFQRCFQPNSLLECNGLQRNEVGHCYNPTPEAMVGESSAGKSIFSALGKSSEIWLRWRVFFPDGIQLHRESMAEIRPHPHER